MTTTETKTDFIKTAQAVAKLVSAELGMSFTCKRSTNSFESAALSVFDLVSGDYNIDLHFDPWQDTGKVRISGTYLSPVYNETAPEAKVSYDRGAQAIASAIVNRFWEGYRVIVDQQRLRKDASIAYQSRKESALGVMMAACHSSARYTREGHDNKGAVLSIELPYHSDGEGCGHGEIKVHEVHDSDNEWTVDLKLDNVPIALAKKLMALVKAYK